MSNPRFNRHRNKGKSFDAIEEKLWTINFITAGVNMKKDILILGDYKNFQYHPFEGIDKILQNLFISAGYNPFCTEDRKELTSEKISNYSLVVSYTDAWEKTLEENEINGLVNFIASGNGFLAIHSGIGYKNIEYANLLKASFIDHPPYQKISYSLAENKHPIIENLKDFCLEDELYRFNFYDKKRCEFLMHGTIESGESQPALWTINHKEGRIVYIAPGHSIESFKNKEFLKLIKNSAVWAMKEI